MFNKSPLITLVLLIQILPKISSAQGLEDNELTEADFFNEFPVILTATRLKQSKNNSPTATTIIDRAMIDASGFTDIVDLLRLAPGMLVNNDSGHIGNAGYQFLFDRYTVRFQVLVDGMSVYTPIFGEMPWTQLGITIDDIERIEVIRGPSSASYGPNAMTGVISIITRHAVLDKGLKFKVNQGVNGRSEQYATMGNSNGNFDYKLSLGAREGDGFKKRHDSKELTIANFRGDYQASNNDVITLSLNYNSGDYQEDGADGLNDTTPDHVKSVQQVSGHSKWIHNFSDGDIFTLSYYQQTFKDKNIYIGDYTADGLGPLNIDESVTTNRKNIELSYSTYSDKYSLTFGALYREDNTIAPQYLFDTNIDIATRQVFINTELHLNKDNILNLGVLRDDNDTGGATTSPRIALNHHIIKNHTARISYAESTRSPFVFEEYTNYVIPDASPPLPVPVVWSDLSDLKPERIKSLELGYIGALNNNTTEIDLRIYKNWLTDIIIIDESIGTGGFMQGDEFTVRGLEATLSHKFKNTKAILNYARSTIKAGNLIHGNPTWYETGAPEDIVSLLIMHDFGNKVSGSLGYYYTGEYKQLCCPDPQDPRRRLDLTLSKSFKWGGYNSKVKFVLQNATNEEINTRLFNNYHRQGYISLSMEL